MKTSPGTRLKTLYLVTIQLEIIEMFAIYENHNPIVSRVYQMYPPYECVLNA